MSRHNNPNKTRYPHATNCDFVGCINFGPERLVCCAGSGRYHTQDHPAAVSH
jgi:hypothetical protein